MLYFELASPAKGKECNVHRAQQHKRGSFKRRFIIDEQQLRRSMREKNT